MRLIFYEWKKLWKNASVFKIFLFFLILSCAVFWGELRETKEWTPAYLKMHNTVDPMKPGEAGEWLSKKQQKQQDFENPKLTMREWRALDRIACETEAINNYDAYRESIQNRYAKSQSISVFSNSDRNQEQYMKKIAKTYEALEVNAPMKLQPYLGIEHLLNFYAGDLLAIVFLLCLVNVVFLQEKKNGKMDFALTMMNGKERLFTAKIVTVYGSFAIYILLSFFINLLIETTLFGRISFQAAIQSLPELYSVPYAWTIGQYVFIYLGLKLLAAGILTALAATLSKQSDSAFITAGGMAVILGVSIWAYEYLQGDGVKAILRLWNIWTFLRGSAIIGNYELICFGNIMINAVWGILLLATAAFGILIFTAKSKPRERKEKIWHKRNKKWKPHTVFYYEMKKLWIYQGGLVVFAASILLLGITVQNYRDYPDTDEYYYHNYIDRFGNQITEDTDMTIKKEEKRLQEIEEKLLHETDSIKAEALNRQLECRGGLRKYIDRVTALRKDKKEPVLLKDIQYSILFNFTEVSRMMIILLCISFAFLIPAAFQREKETHVEILQQTSQDGGKKLWDRKIKTLLLYTIMFISICNILAFLKATKTYHLKLLAPTNCLSAYWKSPFQCPIIVFFFIGVLLQCITASMTVIVLSAFAKRAKNQYVMTGVLLGGTVIPTLLSPTFRRTGLDGYMISSTYLHTANGNIPLLRCFF